MGAAHANLQQPQLAVAVAVAITYVSMPAALEQVALGKRIRDLDLAMELIEDREAARPGRGHMWPGDTPRPDNLAAFNTQVIDRLLQDPVKCMDAIVFTPPEFYFLLPLFTAECIVRHMSAGRKTGFREKLFITLWAMKHNHNYRSMEATFEYASSSCDHFSSKLFSFVLFCFHSPILWVYDTDLFPPFKSAS
jgi:hypothetical protein